MAPQLVKLFFCHFKHEVRRETVDIPSNSPLKGLCFNTVKFSKMKINHYSISTNDEYLLLDNL